MLAQAVSRITAAIPKIIIMRCSFRSTVRVTQVPFEFQFSDLPQELEPRDIE